MNWYKKANNLYYDDPFYRDQEYGYKNGDITKIISEPEDIYGEGAKYYILKEGQAVGHVIGRYVTRGGLGNLKKWFSIENTWTNREVWGSGLYQNAIAEIVKQYLGGVMTKKVQASIPLMKALRKISGAYEDETSIYVPN